MKKRSFSLERIDIFPISIWIVTVFLTWMFMHGADHFLDMTPEALGKYYNVRWILIAHITAGVGALILASTTAYKITFGYALTLQIWAGVWIASTFIAYYTAIRKQFKLHKEWMTRSYIVTVAF